MTHLLLNDQLETLKADIKTTQKAQFKRLLEQCRLYEGEPLSKEVPTTSVTYIGMAAANLSLAYILTEQEHYLEEAKRWISHIKGNFETVFDVLPADGSNYEGTVYWRYAMNFFLNAAELIRADGGKDHFQSDFMKNTFDFQLYQIAPNWEENIGFGDVHNTRSSHSISAYYKLASEHKNEQAQWLGELVREKFLFREAYQSKIFPGILPEAFLELIWFNPDVKSASPEGLPLTRYFPDLGLVVMRSGWDEDATHLSFKSSPPGGHKQWTQSWALDRKNDWFTRSLTHYHVDFNNFILHHNGAALVIDEGYNRTSKAEIHNLITVDGTGCVGEKIWETSDLSDPTLFDLNCNGIFNVWKDVPEEAIAEIEAFSNDNGCRFVVGESSRLYYPEMELTRNARHIIQSETGYFILLDELESALEHTYTWRIHAEKFATQIEDAKFQIQNGSGALNVFTAFPEQSKTKIDETVVEEIMTPQRPDDIRRISLKTLLVENVAPSKTLTFPNVFQPKDSLDQNPATDISVRNIKGKNCIGVEITSAQTVETFLFSRTNQISYEDIQSQSKWISVVTDKLGKTLKTTEYEGK